jgi:hypothetical protein
MATSLASIVGSQQVREPSFSNPYSEMVWKYTNAASQNFSNIINDSRAISKSNFEMDRRNNTEAILQALQKGEITSPDQAGLENYDASYLVDYMDTRRGAELEQSLNVDKLNSDINYKNSLIQQGDNRLAQQDWKNQEYGRHNLATEAEKHIYDTNVVNERAAYHEASQKELSKYHDGLLGNKRDANGIKLMNTIMDGSIDAKNANTKAYKALVGSYFKNGKLDAKGNAKISKDQIGWFNALSNSTYKMMKAKTDKNYKENKMSKALFDVPGAQGKINQTAVDPVDFLSSGFAAFYDQKGNAKLTGPQIKQKNALVKEATARFTKQNIEALATDENINSEDLYSMWKKAKRSGDKNVMNVVGNAIKAKSNKDLGFKTMFTMTGAKDSGKSEDILEALNAVNEYSDYEASRGNEKNALAAIENFDKMFLPKDTHIPKSWGEMKERGLLDKFQDKYFSEFGKSIGPLVSNTYDIGAGSIFEDRDSIIQGYTDAYEGYLENNDIKKNSRTFQARMKKFKKDLMLSLPVETVEDHNELIRTLYPKKR